DELNARWADFATDSSDAARTTAVGWQRATSTAKLGPDRATTGAPGISAATTSVIRAYVPDSIPLLATTDIASGGTWLAALDATRRSTVDGVAKTTSSDPLTTEAMSVEARMP